ncbi:galactosyltransferase-related protein [Roseomonas sp. KE0001]|uniref:glycosyltransferase family 2 protein n=1 Tax=Roseomonas sp. KE0001 TaxID=2479201 RepID=UPI0018DF8D9E|nr:galactosyltransferase-related protein [Roseomonas sp. KE0001]
MPLPAASVLTMARGREGHLRHLLGGLARNTCLPEQCVVVDLGDTALEIPPLPFPVRHHRMPSAGLPLARARNAAAALATAPVLIFLDVDCIPAASLVAGLAADAAAEEALICCEILYLPAGALRDGPDEARLRALGQRHEARSFPPRGLRTEPNAGLFWSLAFAVRRDTFLRLGGFDETYDGYGAEDTDLAFRAREAGLPLLFTASTLAFHQHHTVYDPPLQHFADIVANARRFRDRHGFWPMTGWLDAFHRRGLIAPYAASDRIVVLRPPSTAEIAAAVCPPERAY